MIRPEPLFPRRQNFPIESQRGVEISLLHENTGDVALDRHTDGVVQVRVTSDIEDSPESGSIENQFEIYPNPAAGELKLRFTLPPNAPVYVDLHDTSGRRILRLLESGVAHAGRQEYSLNLDAPGKELRKGSTSSICDQET